MRCFSIYLIAFMWLAVVGVMTGCRPAESQKSAEPKKEEKPFLIGVSLGNLEDPWQTQIKHDLEAAAKKHPDLSLVVVSADNNEKQKQSLGEFLKNRVSVAIVAPIDAQAMTEPVAALFNAGVPVIILDRSVVGDKYTCCIDADWEQIGAAAGKLLAEKLDGKGKIAEIKGPVDSHWADQLHDAFRDQLRDPGYRFVFEGFVDPPRVGAAQLMKDALDDVERIDAVFAFDDAAARAAYEAAHSAGRAKDTLFIGVGYLPDEISKYIKDGVLSASVIVPTGGAEAIDAAAKILSGKKVPKNIVPPPGISG